MGKKWLKCALIRALKTVCQTAIATIGTAVLLSDVNWVALVSASALAGILSMLTSVAGIPEAEEEEEEEEKPEYTDYNLDYEQDMEAKK